MRKRVFKVLILIDKLLNAMMFGDIDETISSRLGKIRVKCGGTIPWSRPVSKVTAAFLDWLDKDHTEEAYEHHKKS